MSPPPIGGPEITPRAPRRARMVLVSGGSARSSSTRDQCVHRQTDGARRSDDEGDHVDARSHAHKAEPDALELFARHGFLSLLDRAPTS